MNRSILERPRPISKTGWRLADVWEYDQYTCQDDSVGREFVSYYECPRTAWRAEFVFFVVSTPGYLEGEPDRFAWIERTEIWQEIDGEQEDLHVEFGEGSYLSYGTIEQAEKAAREEALKDFSFAFWNPRIESEVK